MPARVILAISHEQEQLTVAPVLTKIPGVELIATVTNPAELEQLVAQQVPDLLILSSELAGAGTAGLLERLVARHRLAAVVLLPTEDLRTARRFLRAGAADVIPLPSVADELPELLQTVLRQGTPALRSPLQVGRIIVFYGTKGGVGTSLLTTNVAVALARYLPPDSVCLLDLDLQFGAIPMLLNLQPKTNLATLAQRFQGELDFEMLRSFLLLHSESNLRVLAAPSRPELAELVTTYLIERVLQVLKNHFAFILVDTPNMLQDTTLAALDAADHILIVTALDLLAIRNAEIVLTMFQKLYPAERIRLVLNRSNTRFGGLTPEQVEEHLRMTIAARIPSDGQLAVTSINEGIPFVLQAPDAPISQAIFQLASLIAGQPIGPSETAEATGGSLFRRLVGYLLGEE
jgi:pilus assembly protein CpaE